MKNDSCCKKQRGFGAAYLIGVISLMSIMSAYGFSAMYANKRAEEAYTAKEQIILQTKILNSGILLCSIKYPNGTTGGPTNISLPVSGSATAITCPGAPATQDNISVHFSRYSFPPTEAFINPSLLHDATGLYATWDVTKTDSQTLRIVNMVSASFPAGQATFAANELKIKL